MQNTRQPIAGSHIKEIACFICTYEHFKEITFTLFAASTMRSKSELVSNKP